MIACHDQKLLARLAGELKSMSDRLEMLGADLCADPAAVSRHIAILQEIDQIAQSQSNIADIIGAKSPLDRCRHSSLDHIRRHADL
jgi:hypothetical protein